MSPRFRAEGAVVVAAFLFGVTFVLVKDAVEDMTPLGYLLVRFAVGTAALAPLAVIAARRQPSPRGALWRASAIAGVVLAVAYILQTVGLQYTEASTSGFVTGLYVVFTPVIEGVVRRHAPPTQIVAGIGVATVGLFLLTGAEVAPDRGVVLTLGCAVAVAAWIVYQGAYAERLAVLPFTTLQMGVIAVVCLPGTVATGVGELTRFAIFAAVFTGVACSAVALGLQLYGQRRLSPSRTALILLLEPVFAGLAGYAAGERLGIVKVVGALVILAGIALAELAPGRASGLADETGEGASARHVATDR